MIKQLVTTVLVLFGHHFIVLAQTSFSEQDFLFDRNTIKYSI